MTQAIPSKEQMSLTQVWVQLSADHQAGVIQLMAQLARKLVLAQIESQVQEACDEQDPV
jgi:glycine cleavage system regulatory protein